VLYNKHQLSQNNQKGDNKMNTKAGKPKPSAHRKMPWISKQPAQNQTPEKLFITTLGAGERMP